MTSSTKPEVQNVSQRRHAEEDRATAAGKKVWTGFHRYLLKVMRIFFYLSLLIL